MIIQTIAFYLFAVLVIASGAVTILARNPVHSVLWLILAFFNAAGLMVLVGAEFIAMLLVIVYVGAVAVLFLFVVMMLDIDFAELRAGFAQYLPFGVLLVIILAAEMIFAVGAWKAGGIDMAQRIAPTPEGVSKASALEELRQRLGVEPFATVAIGDGRNDVEMLTWAARGVAMGHADEPVRAAADEVTGTIDDDGAVAVLRSLLA